MKIRTVFSAVVAIAVASFITSSAQAQVGNATNNLFNQYYTQSGQTTAGLYPAPHWVPRNVGHTYNTYQPLMPHEMMYPHSRNYYNFYGGNYYSPQYGYGLGGAPGGCGNAGINGAMTKTTVRWQSSCNHMGPLPGNLYPFANLQSNWARYWYCVRNGGGGSCNRFLGGGALRGGLGCASGNCDGGDVYSTDVYGGETVDSGCAGGCAAKLDDETLSR